MVLSKITNEKVNLNYAGKEKDLRNWDFILLFSSAMVQTFPTVEISVFISKEYSPNYF